LHIPALRLSREAWELMALIQAIVFAIVALAWAVRRRAQLRVLVTAFPTSCWRATLYLCVGLLALLSLDFYIHWTHLTQRSFSALAFYSLTAPCAAYALGIAMMLVWRVGTPPGPESEVPAVPDDLPTAITTQAVPSSADRKLELTTSAANELKQTVDQLITVRAIHTRNDLSLADLARELGISTHAASELLNIHMNVGFYELMNTHRIREAATLLSDPKSTLSIADVAYAAGFNNPNSFYREFKRCHGLTPTQYRRAHQPKSKPQYPHAQIGEASADS
jgi:AraC-like DNA-binding protein